MRRWDEPPSPAQQVRLDRFHWRRFWRIEALVALIAVGGTSIILVTDNTAQLWLHGQETSAVIEAKLESYEDGQMYLVTTGARSYRLADGSRDREPGDRTVILVDPNDPSRARFQRDVQSYLVAAALVATAPIIWPIIAFVGRKPRTTAPRR